MRSHSQLLSSLPCLVTDLEQAAVRGVEGRGSIGTASDCKGAKSGSMFFGPLTTGRVCECEV